MINTMCKRDLVLFNLDWNWRDPADTSVEPWRQAATLVVLRVLVVSSPSSLALPRIAVGLDQSKSVAIA